MANTLSHTQVVADNLVTPLLNTPVVLNKVSRRLMGKADSWNGHELTLRRLPLFQAVMRQTRSATGSDRATNDAYEALPVEAIWAEEKIRVNQLAHIAFPFNNADFLEGLTNSVNSRGYLTSNLHLGAVKRMGESLGTVLDNEASQYLKFFPLSVGNLNQPVDDYRMVARAASKLAAYGCPQNNLQTLIRSENWSLVTDSMTIVRSPDVASDVVRIAKPGMLSGTMTQYYTSNSAFTTGSRLQTGVQVAGAGQGRSAYVTATNQLQHTELALSGLGANTTISAGESFTIQGVKGRNTRQLANLSFDQQFVVLEDVTAGGTGNATIKVVPGIMPYDLTGLTDIQQRTHQAYATVDTTPADGAAITWEYDQNHLAEVSVVMHKDAIEFIPVPLLRPDPGSASSSIVGGDAPDAMDTTAHRNANSLMKKARLNAMSAMQYNWQNATNQFRADVNVSIHMVNPLMGCRVGARIP